MKPALLLAAAVELGVPEALAASGAMTPAALAAAVGANERRLRWLLRALAFTGVVARGQPALEEAYTVGPVAWPAATPTVRGARLLAALLRREEPLGWLEAAGNPEAAALTCAGELTAAELAAPEVARWLAPALVRGGVLLDAGCGAGVYTERVLEELPGARVYLCDLPSVLPLAARRLAGKAARIRLIPGDLRELPLPRCQAVLVSSVLHVLSDEDARRVLERLAAALEPGGRLVVKEVAIDEDGGGPELAVRFALSLALHGPGVLHPAARIESWLRHAGLELVHRGPLASAPETVVIVAAARAPADPDA